MKKTNRRDWMGSSTRLANSFVWDTALVVYVQKCVHVTLKCFNLLVQLLCLWVMVIFCLWRNLMHRFFYKNKNYFEAMSA
jgi:hypothetical protein